jgi:hypothetical protein
VTAAGDAEAEAIADRLASPTKASLRRIGLAGTRPMFIAPTSPLRTLHLVRSAGRELWTLTPLGERVRAAIYGTSKE